MSEVEWLKIDIDETTSMYFPKTEVETLWKKYVNPKGIEFEQFVNELKNFFKELHEKWDKAPKEVKNRYAFNITYLCTKSDKKNVCRAKRNAVCAFIVFKGYTSVYNMIKKNEVAGAESIYTWIRMYRKILTQ